MRLAWSSRPGLPGPVMFYRSSQCQSQNYERRSQLCPLMATYWLHVHIEECEIRIGGIAVAPHVYSDRSGHAEELGSSLRFSHHPARPSVSVVKHSWPAWRRHRGESYEPGTYRVPFTIGHDP